MTSAVTTNSVSERGSGNLSDDVYRHLRDAIVLGELRPNEALVEADIAERLEVSRTPVRESLQRLAADGLIVSRRRRWVVYEHTAAEIAELYEVRAALESHAARLAASRITDEERAILIATRGASTDLSLRPRQRVEENERFHRMIMTMSHNARLVQEFDRNHLYSFNPMNASLYTDRELLITSDQHDQLIDAILAGEAALAGDIARAHVEFSLGIILEHTL